MQNKIKPGHTLTFTAPAGGVVSGNAYLIGTLLVVAAIDAAAGEEFEGDRDGVFDLPKTAGEAWAEGALVYWDNTAKSLTTTSLNNTLVGCAARAQLAADVTGRALLTGVPAAPSAA